LDLLENSEITRQPIGIREVEKKFKHWKRNENGGASYCVETQKNSKYLAWVKKIR